MEGHNEIAPPKFATVVRGYDRPQVDDFVERLSQWVDQADQRAQQSEAAASRAVAEADSLRRRLAAAGTSELTATPESMKALGRRVGSIMQSSFQSAEDLRRQAEEGSRAITAEAEARAFMVVAHATERAEELSGAAEDLFGQAQEMLADANAALARHVHEARAKAAAEHQALVEEARREAHDLARRLEQEERARRQQLAALEEHRQQIIREIALLHQRLGSIGDGLSPLPAPEVSPLPADSGAAGTQDAETGDDVTLVYELPPPRRGNHRKVGAAKH